MLSPAEFQELIALISELMISEGLIHTDAIGRACDSFDELLDEAAAWDQLATRCGNPLATLER